MGLRPWARRVCPWNQVQSRAGPSSRPARLPPSGHAMAVRSRESASSRSLALTARGAGGVYQCSETRASGVGGSTQTGRRHSRLSSRFLRPAPGRRCAYAAGGGLPYPHAFGLGFGSLFSASHPVSRGWPRTASPSPGVGPCPPAPVLAPAHHASCQCGPPIGPSPALQAFGTETGIELACSSRTKGGAAWAPEQGTLMRIWR